MTRKETVQIFEDRKVRSANPVKYISMILCSLVLSGCAGCGAKRKALSVADVAVQSPTLYTYMVKEVYPHDAHAFTQGLYWFDGSLYEGTGLYGASTLRRVELETGGVVQQIVLPDAFFGEGIAQIGDRIYQLTWQSGRAFVYDALTFEKRSEFHYKGEGWGLTTDGERLYMSDGTSLIRVLDPATFRPEREFTVTVEGRPLEHLNELEWIEGEIWANLFMTDQIVRIDPQSGVVTGRIDLTGILPAADRTPDTDVLNGIAWDSVGRRIFVTGKNWPKLFEIEVIKQ